MKNTGTGYPTGLRKPYFDKATDSIPIYCQARQWHLWLKPVPVRSQITIWTHQLCIEFGHTCMTSKFFKYA
eukprot:1948372-Pleurochrysis_carterae.AAC.1